MRSILAAFNYLSKVDIALKYLKHNHAFISFKTYMRVGSASVPLKAYPGASVPATRKNEVGPQEGPQHHRNEDDGNVVAGENGHVPRAAIITRTTQTPYPRLRTEDQGVGKKWKLKSQESFDIRCLFNAYMREWQSTINKSPYVMGVRKYLECETF